jgi:hypothetical protein
LAFSVECEEKESGMILDGDNVNSLSIEKLTTTKHRKHPKRRAASTFVLCT